MHSDMFLGFSAVKVPQTKMVATMGQNSNESQQGDFGSLLGVFLTADTQVAESEPVALPCLSVDGETEVIVIDSQTQAADVEQDTSEEEQVTEVPPHSGQKRSTRPKLGTPIQNKDDNRKWTWLEAAAVPSTEHLHFVPRYGWTPPQEPVDLRTPTAVTTDITVSAELQIPSAIALGSDGLGLMSEAHSGTISHFQIGVPEQGRDLKVEKVHVPPGLIAVEGPEIQEMPVSVGDELLSEPILGADLVAAYDETVSVQNDQTEVQVIRQPPVGLRTLPVLEPQISVERSFAHKEDSVEVLADNSHAVEDVSDEPKDEISVDLRKTEATLRPQEENHVSPFFKTDAVEDQHDLGEVDSEGDSQPVGPSAPSDRMKMRDQVTAKQEVQVLKPSDLMGSFPTTPETQGADPIEKAPDRQTSWLEQPLDLTEQVDAAPRIVERMQALIADERSEVRIQLKPDHLGDLKIKIAVEHGVISAEFVAESQAVQSIIEANLPELRSALQDAGSIVAELAVYVGTQEQQSFGEKQHHERQRWTPPKRLVQSSSLETGQATTYERTSLTQIDLRA